MAWYPWPVVPEPPSYPASRDQSVVSSDGDYHYLGLAPGIAVSAGHDNPAITEASHECEQLISSAVRHLAPEEAATSRIIVTPSVHVMADPDTNRIGSTVPVRIEDDFRFIPIVTLQSPDPIATAAHELAHVHIREGRVSGYELSAFEDPTLIGQLAGTFPIEAYKPAHRPEEAIAFALGVLGAEAMGTECERTLMAADKVRASLTDRAARFADDFVNGSIGRRAPNWLDRKARVALLISPDGSRIPDFSPFRFNVRDFAHGPQYSTGIALGAVDTRPDRPSEVKGFRRVPVPVVRRQQNHVGNIRRKIGYQR